MALRYAAVLRRTKGRVGVCGERHEGSGNRIQETRPEFNMLIVNSMVFYHRWKKNDFTWQDLYKGEGFLHLDRDVKRDIWSDPNFTEPGTADSDEEKHWQLFILALVRFLSQHQVRLDFCHGGVSIKWLTGRPSKHDQALRSVKQGFPSGFSQVFSQQVFSASLLINPSLKPAPWFSSCTKTN